MVSASFPTSFTTQYPNLYLVSASNDLKGFWCPPPQSIFLMTLAIKPKRLTTLFTRTYVLFHFTLFDMTSIFKGGNEGRNKKIFLFLVDSCNLLFTCIIFFI